MIPKIVQTKTKQQADTYINEYMSLYKVAAAFQIVITPEKDELTLDQIHALQKDLEISFSQPILVALFGVERSSSEVQNTLLKLLEEEGERICFILIVESIRGLLPTILSRCTIDHVELATYEIPESILYSDLFSLVNNSDVTKEEALARIDRYISNPQQLHLETLQHFLTIRKLIVDNNMNPSLALDSILLFLQKTGSINVNNEK